MGGKRKSRGRVVDAGDGNWVSQRRRGQAKMEETDRAALEAFKQGQFANREQPKDGQRSGDGSRPSGLQSRPLRDGDPPPGPPTLSKKSPWCSLSFKNKLYWVNAAKGGGLVATATCLPTTHTAGTAPFVERSGQPPRVHQQHRRQARSYPQVRYQ